MTFKALLPRSIQAQMVILIVVAIVVVANAGALIDKLEQPETDPDRIISQAETLAALLSATPEDGRDQLIAVYERAGFSASISPSTVLAAYEDLNEKRPLSEKLLSLLFPIEDDMSPGTKAMIFEGVPVIFVPVDGSKVLVFRSVPPQIFSHDLTSRFAYYFLAFATLVVLFSVFAVRAITAPIRNLADQLGSTDAFLNKNTHLKEEGSREIVELTHVLNDLRARIRSMMAGQANMLRSVSHDLRTPLTRIRLRSERIADPALRDQLAADITVIDHLINTTLEYIRNERVTEKAERADIASVLQTIANDYSDLGKHIIYDGPSKRVWTCKPNSLSRAITNLIDNGFKYGEQVRLMLEESGEDGLRIEVKDDGPGIPEEFRDRVMEPFFKLDAARNEDSAVPSFGLGLSIVDEIVRDHGGSLAFEDNNPRGLIVVLTFPRTS